MSKLLNENNKFVGGYYKSEYLEDVYDEDPEYLTHLLKNYELNPNEERAIKKAIAGETD